ncbi:MAG TPA: MGMT family protein [Clostridia bacterium]|nr:MGMT family protein [Clostridia bacterium]
MKTAIIETDAGFLGASWSGAGLYSLTMPMPDSASAGQELLELSFENLRAAGDGSFSPDRLHSLLAAYFLGGKIKFDIEVDFSGYTLFTRKVLQLTAGIPYGEVCTYGDVARMMGNKKGARAVGRALGANRTPLVIPCHRVIRSDGSLGGFSSGLEWKARLLRLEGFVF